MPILVPADQTVVLKGLKSYADEGQLNDFVQKLGCKTSLACKPIPDRQISGQKQAFLNYRSSSDARAALSKIRSLNKREIVNWKLPEIFKDDVIQCFLKSEGPAKPGSQNQHDSDSEISSEDEDQNLVDVLVEKLKVTPGGGLPGSEVGAMISKKGSWRREVDAAGGVKWWCEDNAGKVKFVNDRGGGIVVLDLLATDLIAGDFVKFAAHTPGYVRGNVPSWGTGVVKSVNVNMCVVDFPEHNGWKGGVQYVVKAEKRDSVLAEAFEPSDTSFDKHAFVRRKETNVFEFTGNTSKSLPQLEREHGFVQAKHNLTETPSDSETWERYFELEILCTAPEGISIGLCGNAFFAGKMLGWVPGSVGYNSERGLLFLGRDDQGESFGPTVSVGDKMGCGLICGLLSTSCYFTVNGHVIGRVLLSKKTDEGSLQLHPAVSASAPAVVKINLNATPPRGAVDVGCVLTTSKWEAKFRDDSKQWKQVSRQGPPSDDGNVPVTFAGYSDIVWVPQQRLRKAQGKASGMEEQWMASFELACLMADDGDVIKVRDIGVHHLTQSMVIRKRISIQGHAGEPKPVISVSGGSVFEIRSEVSINCVCIKSTGGDKTDGIDKGGAAGIVLIAGKLALSSCDIQSVNGTGVALSDDNRPAVLDISSCSIGPCGRHGLVLNGNGNHQISQLRIMDCVLTGIGTNYWTGNKVPQRSLEDCEIARCRRGLMIVLPSQDHLLIKNVAVSDCSEIGVSVIGEMAGKLSCSSEIPTVSFDGCTIKHCVRAFLAEKMIHAKWGASNSISECKTATQASLGAEIEQDGDDRHENKPKTESSEGYNQVGTEEDNFARYFRLLHHTSTKVLLALFKAKYKDSTHKEWSAEYGKELYKALPRESVSKLGKEARVAIESGSTDAWDITLLSALLLFSPGYLRATPEEEWCITIRTHRNHLNHNPPTFKCNTCQGRCSCGLGQPVMEKAEFDSKWKELSDIISKVTANSLSSEQHQSFVRQVEELLTHRFKVSEDREMRDIFYSELKSVTNRISMIEEKAVTKSFLGRALENFQILFKSNGTVDKDQLPRKVILSNNKTYTLTKKAGAGGMGTVFVAFEQDADEQVALKVCDGGDRKRAEREAEVLRRLTKIENHENVVRFIESAIHDSHFVIIMELVKGISLEEWLEKRGRESCPWQESKDIVLGITNGMAEVHKIEISHRDLKPGNVMFDEATGKVVIVDFGLSKQSNAGQTMTMVGGGGFGTKPYMSPEQVDPEFGEVYLPSDVWAIGIIWHEILSGITPFEPIVGNDSTVWAKSSQDERASLKITATNLRHESRMIDKICSEERDWKRLPDDVPRDIIQIIDKCMQLKKAMRYQTAGELLEHLQDVFARLGGSTSDAPQESSAKPFVEWTVDEVCQLLIKCGFSEQAGLCRDEGVDGKTWASLSPEELKDDLGMSSLKLKRFKAELSQ